MNPKSIYISYTQDDMGIVTKIHELLKILFGTGHPIYIHDFDTELGSNKLLTLDKTLEDAKWFIVVYTESYIKSKWVEHEISTQSLKTIEDSGYEILVLKIHDIPYPKHLANFLSKKHNFDATMNLDDAVIEIEEYIKSNEPNILYPQFDAYTNRGGDRDKFWSEVAKKCKIAFVWGWSGIGKTSFVEISVTEKLKKRPLRVKLSRGHSLDRLCRDIINISKEMPQPLNISDSVLLYDALNALKKRSNNFFLFLDDVEYALDTGNTLHSYLENFLRKFLELEIDTWVVLATTRSPDISDDLIARHAGIFNLGLLNNDHIEESLEKHLALANSSEVLKESKIDLDHWNDLIEIINGYPLAVNFVSLTLANGKKLLDILTDNGRKIIQQRSAYSILRSFVDDSMIQDHKDFLLVLAIINHPVTMDDLRSVMIIRSKPLEKLQIIREELLTWRLLESQLDYSSVREYMSLHRLIQIYFTEELQKDISKYEIIAREYGKYAFDKCILLYKQLSAKVDNNNISNGKSIDSKIEWLSNEVFRYAIPADRLLRSVNNLDLANQIPKELRINGTLRELVFFFYEEANDYIKALEYAEKWLAINPNDYRIKLFSARCYRNFRDPKSLKKAEQIINELSESSRIKKRQSQAELYREKALIADFRGNESLAIDYFREGIRLDKSASYIENYTGIAMIFIRQAERLSDWSPERKEKIKEALEILNFAKSHINDTRDSFDLYHLGTYAEALILDGQDDIAFPLLTQALENRPRDSRLKYWIAEIYRKRDELDIAETYAKEALSGETKASMTLANIYRSRAQKEHNNHRRILLLEKALAQLEQFEPQYGSGNEVKATVKSQIFRELDKTEDAFSIISSISETSNSPHVILEYCVVVQILAQKAEIDNSNPARALDLIQSALLLSKKVKNGILDLETMIQKLNDEEKRLKRLI